MLFPYGVFFSPFRLCGCVVNTSAAHTAVHMHTAVQVVRCRSPHSGRLCARGSPESCSIIAPGKGGTAEEKGVASRVLPPKVLALQQKEVEV